MRYPYVIVDEVATAADRAADAVERLKAGPRRGIVPDGIYQDGQLVFGEGPMLLPSEADMIEGDSADKEAVLRHWWAVVGGAPRLRDWL